MKFEGTATYVADDDLKLAVNAAVTSALAATPGSEISLPVSFSKRSIESYVDWLARRYYRAPENARLIGAPAGGPVIVEARR